MDFSFDELVAALLRPETYPGHVDVVEHRETHISHVFLAGDFAYKVKKPIKTTFLDYSTLQRRKHLCHEEMRLDSRFAEQLYLGVVAITHENQIFRLEGTGEPVEYAVKMRRFSEEALLATRVRSGALTDADVVQIAESVADFHEHSSRCDDQRARRSTNFAIENLQQVLQTLTHQLPAEASLLASLNNWSDTFVERYRVGFSRRAEHGAIRECHGDLHLSNLVYWQGQFVPFDGIEFSDDLRFIDVMNDLAFLVMDFAANEHQRWANLLVNAYLQRRGDYRDLAVLRWFQFYRTLIRAMVQNMKAEQHRDEPEIRQASQLKTRRHLAFAQSLTTTAPPRLWITHGFSGSGKSTRAQRHASTNGWIHLRSDIERKRLASETRLPGSLYSTESTRATYQRLRQLAADLLKNGYSVIVDATFLDRAERQRFQQLAAAEASEFGILHCEAQREVLQERIRERSRRNDDVSDADLDVLQRQLANYEPLDDRECSLIVSETNANAQDAKED